MSMFKKQTGISPSGYKYTMDPVSDNPFFADGESPIIDKYIKAVSCTVETVTDGKNYTFKYVDENDLETSYVTVYVPNIAEQITDYVSKITVNEKYEDDIHIFSFVINYVENSVIKTQNISVEVPTVNYIETQISPIRDTANTAANWVQKINDGGTNGQVLTKTDNGAEWKDSESGQTGIPFTFHIEGDDLYCYYSDTTSAPVFDYDGASGDLYLVEGD